MFDPTMPFTVAQGLAAGLSAREIRTEYTRVLGRTYVAPGVHVSHRQRAAAALAVHPRGAVLSHDSVARLIKAPVSLGAEEHVTVADDRDRRQRYGVRSHAMALRLCDVGTLQGLPASVPERNFIELAGRLPLVERVVLGDWLVSEGYTTPEGLTAFCSASPAHHAGWAAHAARYVMRNVGSSRESRLRMLLLLAGLPTPTVGFEVRDTDGTLLMQIDLLFRLREERIAQLRDDRVPIGVAVEYDGRDHLTRERWEKDRVRDDAYADLRLLPIKVTDEGLWKHPDQTLHRIHRALRTIDYPGLGPLHDDWRRHFRL